MIVADVCIDFLTWHDRSKTNALAQAATAEGTGANRKNGEGKENLCSLCFLIKSGPGGTVELDFDKSVSDGANIYAKRGDEPDFTFLARDTCLRRGKTGFGRQPASPCIDKRHLLVATEAERF